MSYVSEAVAEYPQGERLRSGIVITCCWAITLSVLCLFSYAKGVIDVRKEAVENGVAEWAIDSTTGARSFLWISGEN